MIEFSPLSAAQHAHKLHHLNTQMHRLKFKITKEQARQIVKECKNYFSLLPEPHLGVNPWGLIPGELWQMDVTQYDSFRKLKFVHVSIDTFSGFIWASLQTREAASHVISYILHCIAILPQQKLSRWIMGQTILVLNLNIFAPKWQ